MSRLRLIPLVLVTLALPAAAQTLPPPAGVLSLSASASVDVTKDVLGIVFSTTREGNDAQAVQAALKQALDTALAEARKVAKPGQVEVQTGNFSLYPRYANPKPGAQPSIAGWQGSAELLVQGKDIATIAQLAGRVNTLTIQRVGYSLSKEAREKVEAEVTAQAIARWRAKAQQMSQAFGYAGWTVREVNVATNEPQPGLPVPMLRAQAMSAEAAPPLPTEAGKGEVSAAVNGSIQMTR